MFLGKVAITGDSINGYHSDGKYYLTSNSEEVAYYKTKAKNLLSRAGALMEIYRSEHKNLFDSFINSDRVTDGARRRILSTLPIHTISEDLLLKILRRNNVPNEDISKILDFVKQQKNLINTILKSNCLTDEFSEISKESFESDVPSLLLSESFYENKISYTYEEYIEHLNLTRDFEKNNPNYILKPNNQSAFKNIQIYIHEEKWAMISKNTKPTIHFVIKHPKLRDAVENFIAPIVD